MNENSIQPKKLGHNRKRGAVSYRIAQRLDHFKTSMGKTKNDSILIMDDDYELIKK